MQFELRAWHLAALPFELHPEPFLLYFVDRICHCFVQADMDLDPPIYAAYKAGMIGV
jgi:hypothetical protein